MKIIIKCSLKEILEKRGLTQKKFSKMTGLREATISDIVRDTRTTYNREQLGKIMEVLEITDMNEILEVKIES